MPPRTEPAGGVRLLTPWSRGPRGGAGWAADPQAQPGAVLIPSPAPKRTQPGTGNCRHGPAHQATPHPCGRRHRRPLGRISSPMLSVRSREQGTGDNSDGRPLEEDGGQNHSIDHRSNLKQGAVAGGQAEE